MTSGVIHAEKVIYERIVSRMSAQREIRGGPSIRRDPSRISLRSSGYPRFCDATYERKVIYGDAGNGKRTNHQQVAHR
jgi:hypothetical protein